MPIHFRKSVKIAPGTRLNFGKKGVSTSVGSGGLRYTTGKSGNCLYFVFIWPFILIFQLYGFLFKGMAWIFRQAMATPQSRRISLIIIGAMSIIGVGSAAVSAIAGAGASIKSQPVLDQQSIQDTAIAEAWISYTQTIMAMPTNTILPTETVAPLPTQTLVPSPTATFTPLPTFTATAVIIVFPTQPIPVQGGCSCSGDSLNCGDFGSQSSAQACYNSCVAAGMGDIHNLDGDGNGSACESLP